MTQYKVQYYNEKAKAWAVWHITFDMKDAYDTHSGLLNRGYRAAISQIYVEREV